MSRAGRSGRPGAELPEAGARRRGAGAGVEPAVRIRRMRPEEVPRVAELERSCFTVPWEEATFRRLLGSGRARAWTALEADGSIAGYAVMWRTDRGAQLGNLAVRPERRRRGIGRRLVRTALRAAAASGSERLFLEVRESNDAAIRLYRDLGFRRLGRRRDYYRSPREDALLMGKDAR